MAAARPENCPHCGSNDPKHWCRQQQGDKVVFPYETMVEAAADRFNKIGGVDEAFRFLRRGFLELSWRKRWEARSKARQAAEDEKYLEEQRKAGRRPAR